MNALRSNPACSLCGEPGGKLLWQSPLCRVVLVDDRDYPGYCRVILNRHVAEMSDLPAADQTALMTVVFAVEAVLRELVHPDKVNLASLGNMVAHVHWHVIPRWRDDRNFPQPIWGVTQRHGARRADVCESGLAAGLFDRLGSIHL